MTHTAVGEMRIPVCLALNISSSNEELAGRCFEPEDPLRRWTA